jgi:hypothetical protein
MAEQKIEEHHFEDLLNQIVGELRTRITIVKDRTLPQVRAELLLQIVPQLSDAEDMLFSEQDTHDRRRAMARAIDRIAAFLEVPPLTLAIEIERYRIYNSQLPSARESTPQDAPPQTAAEQRDEQSADAALQQAFAEENASISHATSNAT